MNPPLPRFQAVLQSALQRIKQASRLAAERSVDSIGLAALSAQSVRDRDDLLSAQFELNKRLAQFTATFADTLDRRVARATTPRASAAGAAAAGKAAWESLTLVEDREVEAQVLADRFSLAILHESEWELRELDAYMGSMLRLDRPDHDRNPLRPESVGMALVAGTDAVSERAEIRKLLTMEIGRALTSLMRTAYADIVNDLRSAGVQPLSLTLRTSSGGRGGASRSGADSGDTLGLGVDSQAAPLSASGASTRSGGGQSAYGHNSGPNTSRSGRPSLGGRSGARSGYGQGGRNASFGEVDAQLMTLIRRLAFLGNNDGPASGSGSLAAFGPPAGHGGHADGGSTGGYGHATPSRDTQYPQRPLPNLITEHRDELRQASTGALDHMVIDVVGSLFDQILSDPKVSPLMARQIARLQLPVLRVALGDVSFFSSRRHPVRRFVNRIASLACAFDDFTEGAGKQFIGMVQDLVEEIVNGDFDQMEVYEQKLASLEHFIADQTQADVLAQGNAAELLERKESELLQQQRYMQQLQASLTVVEMHDFLRDFLSQVWSQAIVAAQRANDNGELAAKMRRAGRDLVMSVQPKGAPTERKAFLIGLPRLMKELNEGLTMIGWPESAKKKFFSQLLPAHAESLKGQSMRQLDYNLLVRQLDAILGAPLPLPGELPPSGVLPVLDQVVPDLQFTAEEARRVGLVAESAVDWNGQVDIDLSAEPELSEVDIHIDGLPPVEASEPTRGASLVDHVQLGFAYQMHLEGQWQKVRMSYVSPGRAFFVFTRGKKHQQTVSLTHRMLVRMCETGRMRAFENAYLIERATARARRQLAQLGAPAGAAGGRPDTRH